MVWQEAALPMCYIVRKTTTRSMPQSNAVYPKTLQPIGALCVQVVICWQDFVSEHVERLVA